MVSEATESCKIISLVKTMHDLMSHQIKDGVGNAKIVQHIDPVENKEEDSFQKKEIRL